MHPENQTVQQLFQNPMQYMVPFYQRTYVWSKNEQWEPLWEDICKKAEARLESFSTTPHFLGAVVLDRQEKDGIGGVDTLHIIDGQQRLTTLQYVLKAVLITLENINQTETIKRVSDVVVSMIENQNRNTMLDPDREIFKVYPTFFDLDNHKKAFGAASIDELKNKFRDSFTQQGTLRKSRLYAEKPPPPHPKPLEAILFFATALTEWISKNDDREIEKRCEALVSALLNDFKIIAITLGKDDDAQIIFETLNGRGAELHATDLIRNFIFMRADQERRTDQECPLPKKLYDDFWKRFEDNYWKEVHRRGRLTKPIMEWFFQAYLQSIMCREVDLGRLYFEYRHDAISHNKAAEIQLKSLVDYSSVYRKLVDGDGDDPISNFGRKIAPYDLTTLHSLALFIGVSDIDNAEKKEIFNYLLSYVVRRAICGLTQKNYNHVFVRVLSKLSEMELSSSNIQNILLKQQGEATRWPKDAEFENACKTRSLYPETLDAQKMRAVLKELENSIRRDVLGEDANPVKLTDVPDIDHILPRSWFEHWPLPNGKIAKRDEYESAYVKQLHGQELTDHENAIISRQSAVQTLGNLTLLNLKVNREAQHKNFRTKQDLLLKNTNLRLNIDLLDQKIKSWDETSIKERGEMLSKRALCVWPCEK